MEGSEWVCTSCTFVNAAHREFCKACKLKPNWKCLVCKTENHGSTLCCANCLTVKGQKEQPKIDWSSLEAVPEGEEWKCSFCGFGFNGKKSEWCDLCGKKPDWICLACNTQNHGSCLECANCLAHKGAKERPQIDWESIDPVPKNPWKCASCGFDSNDEKLEWCELCSKKPPWKCLACNTENHGSCLECSNCLAHKGAKEKPKIDWEKIEPNPKNPWKCSCGFDFNDEQAVWCEICGKKPAWKCLACETENHGSCLECANCLAHKGAKEKPKIEWEKIEKDEKEGKINV